MKGVNIKGTDEVLKINPWKFHSTYEERLAQTPVNNGKWIGERGESTFIHENEEIKGILSKVNKEGIDYSEAIPDFSLVSKGNVTIEGMSIDRNANFKKADELLAKDWGITPKEVKKWRKQNNFTWHELNDMKSMELVPTIINSKFGHLGGVSEVGKAEKKLLEGDINGKD